MYAVRKPISPIILGLAVTASLLNLSAADKSVSFAKDIQPALESSCLKCHGSAVQLSKLDLGTRDNALKGGEKGAAIVPGRADGKLTAEQISVIKDWIN